MQIPLSSDIAAATAQIAQGRVVAFPTGTSYGLAADALQGFALQRVRNLKGRPTDKRFTVFVADNALETYVAMSDVERRVWPQLAGKPLTLLVRPRPALAHLAQDNVVGLRVIDHPLMQALAEAVGVPLTATSANRAGEAPARSPADITRSWPRPLPDELLDEVKPRGAHGTTYDLSLAMILDGGQLPVREPTSIIQVTETGIRIVRQGNVTATDIEALR